MKRYILTLLLNEECNKVLLMKRKNNPYSGMYNGIGGKVENGENIVQACIRETYEEVGLEIKNPKLLSTTIYPGEKENIELNVFYDFVNEVEISENREGVYSFKPVEFALDFNNRELAGNANVAMFMREILVNEKMFSFYK